MKYLPRQPPFSLSGDLSEYLSVEFQRIRESINTLYDGYLPDTLEAPGGEDNLLLCTDEHYDFGGGAGVYARIGGQWYRLEAVPVARVFPLTGGGRKVGNAATIS